MVIYATIMLLAAIPTFIISIAIYKGKTNLIHDYHQTRVTDKAAYGKAFGRAMLVISSGLLLSGVIALLGDSKTITAISLAVLYLGLIIGIALIVVVQIKHNKGIF